jgi:hypothetical protein
MITQKQVKDLFEYRDGELYWIVSLAHKIKIGDMAGSINNTGYRRVGVNNKDYLNHRLIFLMFHGYLPQYIDHIDGNLLNNRIENLRSATKSENSQNTRKRIDNSSGVKNVTWLKRDKKWRVELNVNGNRKNFGHYYDIEVAKFIAETMRYKYHGAFANHGGVE